MRYDHPAVPRDTAAWYCPARTSMLMKQQFDGASLAHEVAARIVETTVWGTYLWVVFSTGLATQYT